ncbi:MAG: hypothetical protein MHPSP_004659, partial [Paramarteilia canceri]
MTVPFSSESGMGCAFSSSDAQTMQNGEENDKIMQNLADSIDRAENIIIMTGAGIST